MGEVKIIFSNNGGDEHTRRRMTETRRLSVGERLLHQPSALLFDDGFTASDGRSNLSANHLRDDHYSPPPADPLSRSAGDTYPRRHHQWLSRSSLLCILFFCIMTMVVRVISAPPFFNLNSTSWPPWFCAPAPAPAPTRTTYFCSGFKLSPHFLCYQKPRSKRAFFSIGDKTKSSTIITTRVHVPPRNISTLCREPLPSEVQ